MDMRCEEADTMEEQYTLREFLGISRLSERQARRMIADGRLRVVRMAGVRTLRIPASEVARVMGSA
jgi:excisionase family DNA binding protein